MSLEQIRRLELELSVIPFGSPDTYTSTTLLAVRNAAAVRAYDALFNAHRELREYHDQIATKKELEEILTKRGLTISPSSDASSEGVLTQGPAKNRERRLSSS